VLLFDVFLIIVVFAERASMRRVARTVRIIVVVVRLVLWLVRVVMRIIQRFWFVLVSIKVVISSMQWLE